MWQASQNLFFTRKKTLSAYYEMLPVVIFSRWGSHMFYLTFALWNFPNFSHKACLIICTDYL